MSTAFPALLDGFDTIFYEACFTFGAVGDALSALDDSIGAVLD